METMAPIPKSGSRLSASERTTGAVQRSRMQEGGYGSTRKPGGKNVSLEGVGAAVQAGRQPWI